MLFVWLNGMLMLNVMKKSPWTTDAWRLFTVRATLRLRDTSGHLKTTESYNFQYQWYGLSSRNSKLLLLLDICFIGLLVNEAKYRFERDVNVCVN